MNSKGFTLVELLGSMVILGLLMMLVVPNIVGLLNSNKETVYVEDAKKLVNIAKSKASLKKDFTLPTELNHCAFLGLAYLDNSEFDTPPNGGCYDVNRSFVIIKLEGSATEKEYKYYVQLVENYKGKNIGIITPTLSTNVTSDSINTGSVSISRTYDSTDTPGFGSTGCTQYDKIITKNGPKTFSSTSEGICAK